MKKTSTRNLIILALFLVIVTLATTLIKRGHFYDLELYRTGDGWGYDILIKGKPYIHQPFVPAMEGEMPFRDRESARKTGRLVITKIRKKEIPAVSKEEIERILSGK